jgi:hypothetical protein
MVQGESILGVRARSNSPVGVLHDGAARLVANDMEGCCQVVGMADSLFGEV